MMEKHGFETITATDHRAWLWVVSLLSLVYSVLCLGARITDKWDLLAYDDIILGGAYYYFTSRILYIVALCLSKVSVLVFTRRIFSGDIYKEKVFFAVAYVLTAIYGFCGVLLSSAGCRPDQSLALGTNAVCDANVARWAVITAFDVVTEFIILALPVWFISKNQIKASKKRVVMFVFSFRLVVAAFSIATTITYFKYLNGNNGVNINVVPTVVWQEIHLGFSLISASIPCLRSFLWAFMSTGLMTVYGNTTTHGGSYGDSRSPGPSAMRSGNLDDPNAQPRSFQSRLRPDWHGYKVDVRSQQRQSNKAIGSRDGEGGSIKSYGSEQYIIHHTTEVEIERS